MDCDRMLYLIGAVITSAGFIFTESKQEFTWPRIVIWIALLLLMEKYQLVPCALSCPPALIYPLYKLLAATLVTYIGTFMVFPFVEDFNQWTLATSAAMFEHVPLVKTKLPYGANLKVLFAVDLFTSLLALLWVLRSVGLLPYTKSSSSTSSSACPRQSRSRSRRRSRC